MFIIYTLETGNPRSPGERTVHCVDTELPERFFVKDSTQGERSLKKTVDMVSDFMGNLTKDLTKPVQIVGVNKDEMGAKIIEEIIRHTPNYVDVQYATMNRLFKGR